MFLFYALRDEESCNFGVSLAGMVIMVNNESEKMHNNTPLNRDGFGVLFDLDKW